MHWVAIKNAKLVLLITFLFLKLFIFAFTYYKVWLLVEYDYKGLAY